METESKSATEKMRAVLTGTDVVPVLVIRSHLLGDAGLDNVDPLGDRELASALQVSGILLHKLLRRDVLDRHHLIQIAIKKMGDTCVSQQSTPMGNNWPPKKTERR